MSTIVAEPIAFRCTKCFHSNCAMSDDSGASLACSVCGEELIVPDATPDNVKLGHEFLEQNGGSVTGATPNIEEEMTDAEIYKAARMEARAGAGPEALVCSRFKRFLAQMVDTFALMLAVGTGILIAQSMAGNSTTDQVNPMLLMVMLAPMIMLTVVNWCMIAMDGQSVGKLLCRIKIVDLKGESPGFFQGVFMRYWVVGLLNMVPFFGLIDAFWIFSNDAKRCLHDYIAGTFVIDAK